MKEEEKKSFNSIGIVCKHTNHYSRYCDDDNLKFVENCEYEILGLLDESSETTIRAFNLDRERDFPFTVFFTFCYNNWLAFLDRGVDKKDRLSRAIYWKLECIRTYNDWIKSTKYEKEYLEKEIKEVETIIEFIKSNDIDTKTEKILKDLKEYKFEQFLTNKGYNPENIYDLIRNKAGQKLVPYCIALFNKLDFIKYLTDEYFEKKGARNKVLGEMFGCSSETIKNNINVLNVSLNTNMNRYTSHLYEREIEEQLKKIVKNKP